MITGDDHQLAVRPEQFTLAPSPQQLLDALRITAADLIELSDRAGELGPRRRVGRSVHRVALAVAKCTASESARCSLGSPPESSVSISASVGMAVEHSSRDATIAPAAFACCSTFCSGQPASRPWQSDPPNESPAPRPLSGRIGMGGDSTRSLLVLAKTPFGPCFTMASSTPAASSASA